jgi:hypothetical protein
MGIDPAGGAPDDEATSYHSAQKLVKPLRPLQPPRSLERRATDMTELFSTFAVFVLIIGPFVALALLAGRYGVDSRPTIGDDRYHSTTSWT